MRTIFSTLLALCGVAILLPDAAAAQQRRAGYMSSIDTTVAIERGGVVELSHISGDITVTTWNRDEVRVVAFAERAQIISDFSRRRISLRIEDPDRDNRDNRGRDRSRRGDWIGESRYEITVPRGIRVVAATISGDVSVVGTNGQVSARTVSGDATVEDASGTVEVTSVGGDATLRRANGRMTVTTVSGDASISNGTGDVRASTVSGDVQLAAMRASSVEASTTSGDVSYAGPIDPSGRYNLTTHSGDIVLRIPAETRATVTASTFSGELDTDFPVTLAPASTARQRGSTLEFPLGSGGGASIALRTFSGDIVLRRPR